MIIGCRDISNVVSFLERDFNLVYPSLSVIGNDEKTNFDVLLMFDDELNIDIDLLNIKTIGTKRYSKFEQSLILNKLGIKHPKTFKNIINASLDDRDNLMMVMLDKYDDNDNLLLKINEGARGLGQIIINKQSYYELIEFIRKNNDYLKIFKFIKDNYDIGSNEYNEIEKERFIEALINRDYVIQEFKNILSEWRLISFYGEEPIIINRNRDENSWQSKTTNDGTVVNNSEFQYFEYFNQIANKLMEKLNTPWLSIDIYLDDNGDVGVIEFQMQMGYNKAPKKLLVDKINKSVKNIIK